ncbi:MAG: tetratricopeptide repeat protein [Acidobacteria bacterium]|nr:tetratricopeptide repeat protein [Acidobacteriota bacterium]
MFSRNFDRRTLTTSWIAGAILALAMPALAQTGRIQGKVTDDKDAPVPGAKIQVTAVPDQGGQKWEATTDKNGSYIIGTLPRSGQYQIVATKEGVGQDEARAAVKIGNFTTTNLKLSNAVRLTEEQAKKNAAIKKFLEDGVAAANAENHQGAVTAFTSAAAALPTCTDCFFNIGVSQQQLKNFTEAEAAFRKAIELRPSYPEAYNALAAIYTAQKKLDLAAEASAKSAELSVASVGGGNADSLYNAAVGLWNANKFPAAGSTLEAAIKADPNHADSHFMLGKVYLNLGKMKEAAGEYEMYLKLQPSGKNAAEAQKTFDALKPMLK